MNPNKHTCTHKNILILTGVLIVIICLFFLSKHSVPSQNPIQTAAESAPIASNTTEAILNALKADSSRGLSDTQKEQMLASLKSKQSAQTLSNDQKVQILDELKNQ